MPGQGKYTVYAPEANAKNTLLGRLFPEAPTAEFVGKENEYRAQVTNVGSQYLTPDTAIGDPYFGPGVDLNYGNAPDILAGADGMWNQPGDPANSFAPDISSPGVGKIDGTDKVSDPNLKASDLKPNYVPGGPSTGTRSPAASAQKIGALVLGSSTTKPGSSDSST